MKLIFRILMIVIVGSGVLVLQTCSKKTPEVFIISPHDGAQVDSTFTVSFGASKVDITPAGVDKPNSGHHHLLIDAPLPSDLTKPLGAEVMHFGKGETEVQLTLSPGLHSLQLILGDKNHIPHQPAIVSRKIIILVRDKLESENKEALEVEVVDEGVAP
jgi:hypothetical protein